MFMVDDANNNRNAEPRKKALLLGLGLDKDAKDEKRVTVGKNFLLAGGSKPTHELMQEKAVKFNEELERRNKRLEDIGHDEFLEIAERVKMDEKP